uniref:PPARGC1 and ESRR induced regulator, muscle 1 n=1 Tax=Rhinopithecus bieti TaxID=61621 RepID=A0A2K6LZ88_RHIBE
MELRGGGTPGSHCSSCPGPASSGDQMHRLLQGPAPRPPGEPPRSPESPGHSTGSQRPPDSPGGPARSPSRKKRRAVGAKGGGHAGASTSAQTGSPLLPAASPETAKLTAKARQEELGLGPTGAPEPGPDLGLSTLVPVTEQGTDQIRAPPRAELHTVSTPVQEAHPDVSRAKSDMAVSTPASELQPDTAVSTLASEPQSSVAPSTPISKLQPDTDMAVSTPVSEHGLDMALPTAGPVAKLEVASSPPVSEAVPRMTESGGLVSTPVPTADVAGPAWSPTRRAGPDVETEVVVSALSAGAPGHRSGEPAPGLTQVPKKKKVRFSVAGPGPNKPGSGEASARPSAPQTATGGHGGPGAWDAVAVGPRPHQPRILKHLPRPPPSAVMRAGPGCSFAVTLPEAYEFFFCDTIEEDQDAEAAAAGQDPAGIQWPDMCEFFFQDTGAQRPRQRGAPAPLPRADPVPAPVPGDPVPISIPEVYEHFFREDRLEGVLAPAVLPQLQALEPPRSAFQGAGPETPLKPAAAERLHLALRRAAELRGPVPSFAFSQNDMCLVFVALATWAVRTSDLHTPDAWKTVLLANIGTISAIRYFRRQVGQERHSPSS